MIGWRLKQGTIVSIALILALAGCQARETRFEIINHRAGASPELYHEMFDDCSYGFTADGNVDFVARKAIPDDSGGTLVQILHVRTIFRTDPGRTYADRTMINARVSYAIIDDTGGACFEGGGFFSCKDNPKKAILRGELEQAKLRSNRRIGHSMDIFERAEISGKFEAYRNESEVAKVLNELNRVFGPQPDYTQPPGDPDAL